MSNAKKEEKSLMSRAADSVGNFFGGMASDISNAFNYSNLSASEQDLHRAVTTATVASEKARNAASGEGDKAHRAFKARAAAKRSAMSIAPVAAAPSVPDPNAIGKTEQALLDQQKKGRSATIETSSQGLLSDEDSTRKKRSLMGGLLT